VGLDGVKEKQDEKRGERGIHTISYILPVLLNLANIQDGWQ